jgi:DNA helicase-2/ATP-dependent DNA helicase PcrA
MSADPKSAVLNAAQKRAATFGTVLPDRRGVQAGPLLVVAGAGTGKTNTVAHRVAHLIVNGVDPARILLLTFTRRAAQEMRRRAHDMVRQQLNDALGDRSKQLLQRLSWAGTFMAAAAASSATRCSSAATRSASRARVSRRAR